VCHETVIYRSTVHIKRSGRQHRPPGNAQGDGSAQPTNRLTTPIVLADLPHALEPVALD